MSRDIDAKVAEKIMGWHKCHLNCEGGCFWLDADGSVWHHGGIVPFSPSTEPAAAMWVVGRMRDLGYGVDIDNVTGKDVPIWQVRFGKMTGKRWEYDGTYFDKSFGEAVSQAALRAVAGDEGGGE